MSNELALGNSDEQPTLYHERQKLQLCALHSLNSLFQKSLFNKHSLDAIVREYDKSWCFNEYSSFFTGNYDLTILLEALERNGYTLRAIDTNERLDSFDFKDCFGLLLNIPLKQPVFDRLPFIRRFTKPGRHWLSIKRIDREQFYDMDSKLSHPKLIGDQTNLIEHLTNKFDRSQTYIYIVIEKTMAERFAQK